MHPDFWQNTWAERSIGFHQAAPNPLLVEYWPTLGLPPDALVFVPLAGKSLDLRWLRDRGHGVLAVELSPIAVREFFEEAGLEPVRQRQGPFEPWSAGGYRVLRGDFFDLRAEDLRGVRAVYDRAALVALPPEMRRAYARALAEHLPPSVTILLIAMEARAPATQGPPFSVVEGEVRALFEPAFDVHLLCRTPFAELTSSAGAVVARSSAVYAMRR